MATFWFLLLILVPATPVTAQEAPAAGRLRVYLDCGSCDFSYVRTEITWVDWVRDRQDSDVHVLVTTQTTGGGGREYTMEFIGRNRFAAKQDTLLHRSTRDDTQDLVRQGLTQVLKMGLMRYLVGTPAERELRITMPPPGGPGRPGMPAAPQAGTRDPWNAWVFSIGGNANVFGESQQQQGSYNASFSAGRTTEEWKISSRLSRSYNESSFEVGSETFTSIRKSANASLVAVKSLGAQFSAGVSADVTSSTFGNIEIGFRVAPAIEYDIFPYAQSTRRIFTLRYTAGLTSYDYREITVYDELKETRPTHAFEASYRMTQPWGSVGLGLDFSQFLHDTGKWRGSLNGSTSLRLVKGLNLNLGGSYSRVRDQLTLAKAGATRDEILLRLKQLETNYFYYFSFGLSYRFGSSLNNVVNPRMGGLGGFGGSEGIMIFF